MSTDLSPTKVMWTVLGIGTAMLIPFMGWLANRSIAHDAQISAVQYQIQSMLQIQSNTISPVVEASLRELRDKSNEDRKLIQIIAESSSRNTLEIGYLKERTKTDKP